MASWGLQRLNGQVCEGMFAVDVIKAHLFFFEEEFNAADGAVAVFSDKNVCDAGAVRVFFVVIFTVHHENDVRVLLDGSGFAEIRELGDFDGTGFDGAGEL